MKIEILVVPDPLNNFQLIMKVDFIWPKCPNYALKLQNGKINSWDSTLMKNANNSRWNNCTFTKIEILVVPDPLNNFQLIMKVDFLWPKCSNYALNLQYRKINSWDSTLMENANNSKWNNCTFIKFEILVVPDPLNNFQLIMKVVLLWPKCLKYALKLTNK